MVPKPEEAFEEVYQAENSQERSIYSNSDGEGCAILVKAGKLDSFTPQSRFKRQEVKNMSKSDDLSENEYQTLNHSAGLFREKRSKSETRGRSSTRTYGQGKLSRSSSRDQIRIGDRVIIKGKYIGTCRYVGPIEEEDFSLPEIWFGVQLDEKLTNNSGIFGSREYFNCPFGFGVMVTINKIRKIKSCNVSFKNGPTTTSLRPSKSMSNLNSMMRKVSIGANSQGDSSPKRGRSRRKWDLDNAHPMHTLNQIKDIQRNRPFDQNSFGSDPFGLPLQGFNSATQGYPNNDLLRRSFERIVSYHGEPYRNHLERNQSLPTLPTYGHQSFNPIHRSYSLNDNVLRNHTLEYSAHPFRKVAITKNRRDYIHSQNEVNDVSSYKLTTRRRTSAQSLSSGSSNSFSFQKRQLCPKCANCTTCVVQQSYTGSSDNGFGSETQKPLIYNQSRFRKLA